MPFIEALRQFQFRVGRDNFCLVHVSLVPVLGVVGEQVSNILLRKISKDKEEPDFKAGMVLMYFGVC
jgi:CTP synthase (UTP-ammonia lyase)